MLLGTYSGTTFFFENTGSATAPVFIERSGVANPFQGLTVTGNRESIPSFVDIDEDGDSDLFIGSSKYSTLNRVAFFQNTGSATNPVFVAADDPIEEISSFTHGYNSYNAVSLAFVDIDGDSHPDVVAGQRGTRIKVFINDGTGTSFTQEEGPWEEEVSDYFSNGSPAFGDFDKDGDLDLAVGLQESGSPSILYFENTDGAFTLEANNELNGNNPFGGVIVNRMARVTFADLDGDEELDAVVGSKYGSGLLVYINNEGTFNIDEDHPLSTDLDLTLQSLPTFVDIDGDGDLDLFVGSEQEFYNDAFFFRNNNGIFTYEESPLPPSLSHAFLDVDGDGDLDAFFTDRDDSPVRFYRNSGSRTNPVITAATTPAPFSNLDGKYLSYVTAFDFDHDGDTDIVLNVNERPSGGDYLKTKLYFVENNGNGTLPLSLT